MDDPFFEPSALPQIPGWDSYFMTMVYLVAMRSKDDNTHIGAIITGPDHEVRSTGYNSYPRHINDGLPERQQRPEKYYWFEHAERNAIYNAARVGIPLLGCHMYTNGIPCMDCARAIVQSGITEVIVDKEWDNNNGAKWQEHSGRSRILFEEAGVKLRFWSGDIARINRYRRGELF